MSSRTATISRWVVCPLLGLLATSLVVALYLGGLGRKIELQALDQRFRLLATAPENDRVVHVDIDDRSLNEMGRWPWPRAQLAGIVDVLRQAGARSVALDIIMPEPQKTRYVSEATDVYSADTGKLLGNAAPRAVFDDEILQRSLADSGCVFLPMHIQIKHSEPTATEQRLVQLLTQRPDLTVQQLATEAKLPHPIQGDIVARCRRRAIEQRVQETLLQQPAAPLMAVARLVIGQAAEQTRSEAFDIVRRAYLRVRGIVALERFALPEGSAGGYPALNGQATPALVTLANAAYGSGFVTVDPDDDGVVRRIPMIVASDGRLYPQFALTLAADQLARRHGGSYSLTAGDEEVLIRCDDGFERSIPIDAEGYMLINWIRRDGEETHPRHISAAKVVTVWLMQQSLTRNARLRRLLQLHLVGMAREFPTPRLKELYWRLTELDGQANALHQKRIAAQMDYRRAMLFAPNELPDSPAALLVREDELEAEIGTICDELCEALRDANHLDVFLARPAPPETPSTGPAGEDSNDEYRLALAAFAARKAEATDALSKLDRIVSANAAIEREIGEQTRQLRQWIDGRLCLVGSVASGAADFVPTPMDGRTPGVVVHSNILNTIVSGAFVRRVHPAVDTAIILLVGAIVAVITATRPVFIAAPLTLVVAAAYVAVNALLFRGMGVWAAFWAPPAAMAASFSMVTAYRQLTEERARRRIRAMFAHALSPALVDRLEEDPSLAKLGGERRELTFFFSDLQGFTRLSERLGEEQTVRLLNRYFDRMTETVQDHFGGYLNKFLGDGLFVFFGAPVLQADHAARALRAAVQCLHQVDELNDELANEAGAKVKLSARVGIATGQSMVGNCGSSQRMDYTAIGDPVNLASRLESANKFFGTRILVADETWRQAGDESLLARPFGKIAVVGRKEAVIVWNVLGHRDTADEDVCRACQHFAEAMEHFAAQRFAQAAKLFESVGTLMPDDRPAEIFADLCRAHLAAPPGDDWNGVLQLTEK